MSAILPQNETYTDDIGDLVSVALEPLKLYFETLIDVDANIAYVGRSLHERAMIRIDEALELLDKQVGQVKFTGAKYQNSKGIPGGKLLSCCVC